MEQIQIATGAKPENYTPEEAARLLRYNDRKAFYDAVHRDGIPYLRQNARRYLFPAAPLHAWLSRRAVGMTGGLT